MEYDAYYPPALPPPDQSISGQTVSTLEEPRVVYECDDPTNGTEANPMVVGEQNVYGSDEEWLNQWWAGAYLGSISPTVSHPRPMSQIMSSPEDSARTRLPSMPLYNSLLGSGASYSVVGLPWSHTWRQRILSHGRSASSEAINSSDSAAGNYSHRSAVF